jgi:hypothetical protein
MKNVVKVYVVTDIDDCGTIMLHGTIEDVRKFAKDKFDDLWSDLTPYPMEEEEYYMYCDDDTNLLKALDTMGYEMKEICEVPIEDFN